MDELTPKDRAEILTLYLSGHSVNHIVFLLEHRWRIDVVNQVIRDAVIYLLNAMHYERGDDPDTTIEYVSESPSWHEPPVEAYLAVLRTTKGPKRHELGSDSKTPGDSR